MRKMPGINAAIGVIAAVAVTLLVSCGSSGKSSDSSTTTTAPASKSAASDAVVTAKKTDKLGTVLADKDGMTLYTLTKDGKAMSCTGACLQAWPPITLPAGETTPKAAAGIIGLSALKGSGMTLVAVDGLPLYRFVKDKDSEDVYGDGLASFGGVWHVAKTSATASAPSDDDKSTDTTTGTTPTTTSSGY